jgi:hypothetical protein
MPAAAIAFAFLNVAAESDRGPVCPACGSENISGIEWYGPTGVTGPDGGQEYRMQYGIKCRDCGELEEL